MSEKNGLKLVQRNLIEEFPSSLFGLNDMYVIGLGCCGGGPLFKNCLDLNLTLTEKSLSTTNKVNEVTITGCLDAIVPNIEIKTHFLRVYNSPSISSLNRNMFKNMQFVILLLINSCCTTS